MLYLLQGLLSERSSLVLALNISSSQNIHLYILFNPLSLFNSLGLVDLSALFLDASLLVVDIDVNDIVLMEFLCPSLRDTILDFIFKLIFVWAFR